MIAINKNEANEIRKNFKNVHIVRTCKQKSKRHHYYATEYRGVIELLKKMRGVTHV